MSTVAIPLTKGRFAYVSECDVHLVEGRKWCVTANGRGQQYAHAKIGGRHVSMHRLILGLARGCGLVVDHVDGDGLNNTRANIRVCTSQQNNSRRASYVKHGSAPRGAYREKRRWVARICCKGVVHHLGRFDTADEAGAAYAAAAARLFGEFAPAPSRPGSLIGGRRFHVSMVADGRL